MAVMALGNVNLTKKTQATRLRNVCPAIKRARVKNTKQVMPSTLDYLLENGVLTERSMNR